MNRIPLPRLGEAGFTLVELVIVIVILGALAVVVLPRLGESSFRSAAFAEQVATAFRYAQRLAVATGCEIQVDVSSATSSYAVRRRSDGTDTSCGTAGGFTLDVPNPGGSGAFAGTATGGVTVTQGLVITFNAQGLPSPNGGTAVVGGRSIIVEADTGHVR
ncbi:type II secretion system protein [Silanimonas sp.]|jgi:MSHA pilin protein MshC|uniref:type II secretion system protein n=1 Tax=Silanimonas sp. TaxID=1929290 RepID=UPI0022C58588|nr:type II secretion system protein [Silanimonas sp.]MCZ8113873.1 type II secretion system protein [Silanimonas sp.]